MLQAVDVAGKAGRPPKGPRSNTALRLTAEQKRKLEALAATRRLGFNDTLVALIEESYAQTPNPGPDLFREGSAHLEGKRYLKAVPPLRQAAKFLPDRLDVQLAYATAAERAQEDVAEALAAYRQVIEMDPQHVAAHQGAGRCLSEMGQAREAAKMMARAAALEARAADRAAGEAIRKRAEDPAPAPARKSSSRKRRAG